ncbi:cysteine proteinase [Lichtheimia hyalospora FSU 10163]|nr:cysteine proteinase [Lichtheimia hyalospora FSU 10163]
MNFASQSSHPIYYQPRESAIDDAPIEPYAPGPPPPPARSVVLHYEDIAKQQLGIIKDGDVYELKCVHWYVSDFHDNPDKVYGPDFKAGGNSWRLVLYPRGKDGLSEHVSIDLQWTSGRYASSYDHIHVQFVICMSTMSFPTNYTCCSTSFRFTKAENEHGFTEFGNFDHLTRNDFDTGREAFVKNNKTRITCIIRILKPTIENNSRFVGTSADPYNSRAKTGYIGLRRIGKTSYMEAVLQLLFNIRKFRKAIYNIPTGTVGGITTTPADSPALALQRLFYRMQCGTDCPSIAELVQSFGWSDRDINTSDGDECIQFLLAFLRSMDDTYFNKTSPWSETRKLFGNEVAHAGQEYFLESMISIDTTGCSSLQESLSKATKRDWAFRKRFRIKALAPVLLFELDIWRQDYASNLHKIDHHVSYPLHLNMSPYTETFARDTEWERYTLFGMIMHYGSAKNGNHCTYINSLTGHSEWIKFDGWKVENVPADEVLDPQHRHGSARRYNRNNPYVLCYIRESHLNDVLCHIKEEDIPPHIRNTNI